MFYEKTSRETGWWEGINVAELVIEALQEPPRPHSQTIGILGDKKIKLQFTLLESQQTAKEKAFETEELECRRNAWEKIFDTEKRFNTEVDMLHTKNYNP